MKTLFISSFILSLRYSNRFGKSLVMFMNNSYLHLRYNLNQLYNTLIVKEWICIYQPDFQCRAKEPLHVEEILSFYQSDNPDKEISIIKGEKGKFLFVDKNISFLKSYLMIIQIKFYVLKLIRNKLKNWYFVRKEDIFLPVFQYFLQQLLLN